MIPRNIYFQIELVYARIFLQKWNENVRTM